MFDNPSSSSWNPKVTTVPSHGLYLYDIGYDEADLVAPVKEAPIKLEQPILNENQFKNPSDLKKEIIKQRIENRRASLNARISKSLNTIKEHELLRANKE